MPRKHNFGRTSGANIRAKRKIIHRCTSCAHMHENKPDFTCDIYGCLGTTFERFDSKAECIRYAELLMLERAGKITDLRRQTSFALLAYVSDGNHHKVGKFISDFDYKNSSGEYVVEDVKGNMMTDLAAWKLKHFKAQYGFDVSIVRR